MPKWGEHCGCGVPEEAGYRVTVTVSDVNGGNGDVFQMFKCRTHRMDYTEGRTIEHAGRSLVIRKVDAVHLRGPE